MKSVRVNRHNYEEFFLLYVDNELDSSERTAVEKFISQNADLARELEMLQQTTLGDNTISFAKKESLYKKDDGISLANYEEYFLLATDNELNEQQFAAVEEFVLKHPQLQDEFTLLHQTRLQPELISFTNKKILYRYQKERRRRIPVIFLRVSAAAAVIAIIITTAVINRTDKNNNNSMVFTKSNKSIKTQPENIDKPLVTAVTEKTTDTLRAKKELTTNLRNVAVRNNKHIKSNLTANKKVQNYKEEIAAFKVNPKLRTVIKSDTLAIAKTITDEPKNPVSQKIKTESLEDKSISDINNDYPNYGNAFSLAKQNITKEKPVIVSHAVYLQTDNDEEEKTLYIGSAEINKNKLKGLFKKATAFLDKKIRRNKE